MTPTTVAQALERFALSEPVQKNERLLRDLRTALRHFVLPHYAYPTSAVNSFQKLNDALSQISLAEFACAGLHFEATALDLINQGKEKQTLDRYQAALHSFMRWLCTQEWYQQAIQPQEERFAWHLKSKANIETSRAGKKPLRGAPYALKEAVMSEGLQQEFKVLTQFWTMMEHPDRKDSYLRTATMHSRLVSLRSFLGWLHHSQGRPIDQLTLSLSMDLNLLCAFVSWGINERGNSHAWAMNIGKASLTVAKWHYGPQSKRRAYRDIPEIEAIRDKVAEWSSKTRKEAKRTVSRLALREKLQTMEELWFVCRYLRRCCYASRRTNYVKGSDYTLMQSWQRYLIIAILTYCPIRQREIRELRLEQTLFRAADCYWVVLEAADHKNGSRTGEGREFPLPKHLTADLDEWLSVWRPKVTLAHQYVFFSVDHSKPRSFGQPFTAPALYRMVKTIMFSTTSYLFGKPKRTTPHDFRRIAVTWQRKYGVAEEQAGLAEMMGHSVEQANRLYWQSTSGQKAQAASEWWRTERPSLQSADVNSDWLAS